MSEVKHVSQENLDAFKNQEIDAHNKLLAMKEVLDAAVGNGLTDEEIKNLACEVAHITDCVAKMSNEITGNAKS